MKNRILLTLTLMIYCSFAVCQENNSLYQEEEVSFNNQEIKITATLSIPSNKTNYPAIVIIHGSGNSSRENLWTTAYADALIKRGIAVLHPDKRGSGQTSGSWITSNFSELADDAIAGVEYLKNLTDVDKDRIGVIGFSQGGHIVPIAASKSMDIKFAISISASVVPMMEQIMDEIEIMAEKEGLNSAQIKQVKEINKKAIYAALTDTDGEDYLEALNEAKNGALKGKKIVEGFPTDPEHPSKKFLHTIGDYDPIPFWKRVSVPILFVYGGKDTNIRIQKSITRIGETLGESDYNYSILFFKNNGHALYREDLIDFISRWIKDKGVN